MNIVTRYDYTGEEGAAVYSVVAGKEQGSGRSHNGAPVFFRFVPGPAVFRTGLIHPCQTREVAVSHHDWRARGW